MEYNINGKKLVWEVHETETNAANLKDNNLYMEDIWNMNDIVGHSTACAELHIISPDTFYFVTSDGFGFTMRYDGNRIVCLNMWSQNGGRRGNGFFAPVNSELVGCRLHLTYNLNGKKLMWELDITETCPGNCKLDNLYLEDIWNMRDTVGESTTCGVINILSPDTFYFVTFDGLGFTMQYDGDHMVCIKKWWTK